MTALTAAGAFAAAGTGFAQAPAEGAQAVVVPPDVPGVNAPGASTTLRTTSTFDDSLAAQIAALLAGDPALKGASLRVAAKDGNVTLSGTTIDGAQAARARQLVDPIVGVGHASYLIAAQAALSSASGLAVVRP